MDQLDGLVDSMRTLLRIALLLSVLGLAAYLFYGCDKIESATQADTTETAAPRAPSNYAPGDIPRNAVKFRDSLIREVRFRWGLDEQPALFFGQIHQESAWRPEASSAYANGLTQFTPETSEWIQNLYPSDLGEFCPDRAGCPFDARWAIRAMVTYDKRLYDVFVKSTGDDRYAFMLSSYNGGLGWVQKEQRAASARKIDSAEWFGKVEKVCLRAEWACAENRDYPNKILFKWKPLYQSWLVE